VRFAWTMLAACAVACGGGGAAPTEDAGPPAVEVAVTGPARLELGVGTTRFEALAEGGAVELVLGPQGGWHVDLTARGENLLPDGLTLRYEVRDDARPTPWNHPVTASLNARRVLADGGGWVRVGDRAVFDIRAAGEVTGLRVRVTVRAERGGAVVAEDSRTVRVVDDARP
jgi:hypothetical protein